MNLYGGIKTDIIDLLKIEYNRLNNNNRDQDELDEDLNVEINEDYDSDNELFQGNQNQHTIAEDSIYINEGVMPQQVS